MMKNTMRYRGILITLFFLVNVPILTAADADLASRIEPLVKAHEGRVAIAVQKFGDPVAFSLNADEAMPTASLIKFPVMVEAYFQFSEGKAKPNDVCILQK